MTFPSINFKFNDLPEAQALRELVEQKMEAFEKYLHDGNSVGCEVEFSKEAAHQTGQVYKLSAHIKIDGNTYHADATEESFEKAIDEVRDELDKELRRAKEKQVSRHKQAGREAKEKMLAAEGTGL